MVSPMSRVNEIVSSQIGNYLTNKKTWDIIYNVKDYGAKGDGATDDTTSIQSAIDEAKAAGGGIVFFPTGVYPFSKISIIRSSTDSADMNIKIVGSPGAILASDKTEAIAIEITGYDSGSFDANNVIRRVYFENIQIRGDYLTGTNLMSGAGIKMTAAQKLGFKDVFIRGYSEGGLIGAQLWDSNFDGVEVRYCGRGTSSGSYAYAIDLGKYYDNSNANHFIGCQFELCPLIMIVNEGARHNYWTNCKFEHGNVVNNSSQSPIAIGDAIELGFTDCMFVKNTNSSDLHITVNNVKFSDPSVANVEKSIKFTSCHFVGSSGVNVRWLNINYTELINCTFNSTDGSSTSGYPIMIGTKVLMTSCKVVIATNDTQTINITGNDNTIMNLEVDYKGSSPTKGAFLKLNTGVTENKIVDFDIIGTPFSPYDAASYLDTNIVMRKRGFVVDAATTSLAYGANVLVFAHSSNTTVTAINFGYNGHFITVRAKTAQITLQNNASIVTKSGADLVLTAGQVAILTNIAGVWYEV